MLHVFMGTFLTIIKKVDIVKGPAIGLSDVPPLPLINLMETAFTTQESEMNRPGISIFIADICYGEAAGFPRYIIATS